MAETIMTFIAVVAIIALVGLIAAILYGVATVQGMIGTGKGAAKMIERPKNAALKIADTGKVLAFKLRDRAVVIGGHVKTGANAVASIKSNVEKVSRAAKS